MFLEVLTNNLTTFVVFLVLLFLTWILQRIRRPPGIPPGPTRLPFLGNILTLRGDRRKDFMTLRRRYGDVFSIYFGETLIIVVNGYEALKEAFVKNGDVFSDRPSLESFSFMPDFFREQRGVFRSSGEVWRKNRRFAISTLRDFGMGKNKLQIMIQEESTYLIQAIESLDGQAFDLADVIHNAVSNIICSLVFGKRFDYSNKEFQHYLEAISKIVAGFDNRIMLLRVPLLRILPGDITGLKDIMKNTNNVSDFINAMIIERLDVYDEQQINCLIDAYIKEEKLDKQKFSPTDNHGQELARLIFDLFLAGTETTATFLKWAILYYLNFPEVQNRAWSQVSNVVGSERLPGMEDRKRMPYFEAMILEVLRHANIVPMSVFHAVSDNTKLRGYHIPKGTIAIVNIDSVMTDPHLWPNPHQFDPDRFLESEFLQKFEHFIPFSLGKRVCLGESLARMELTIFLAALTKHFEFLPPEGEDSAPLEGKLAVTYSPNRYMVRAVKRATE